MSQLQTKAFITNNFLLQSKEAETLYHTYAKNMPVIDYHNHLSPKQIAENIKKTIKGFKIVYKPDYRQAIASSWPSSIDDSQARKDWGWQHEYNLDAISKEMLVNLSRKKLNI